MLKFYRFKKDTLMIASPTKFKKSHRRNQTHTPQTLQELFEGSMATFYIENP